MYHLENVKFGTLTMKDRLQFREKTCGRKPIETAILFHHNIKTNIVLLSGSLI